jgi:hypothetical protein
MRDGHRFKMMIAHLVIGWSFAHCHVNFQKSPELTMEFYRIEIIPLRFANPGMSLP